MRVKPIFVYPWLAYLLRQSTAFLLCLIPVCPLIAQPIYRFSTNADRLYRLAFPTTSIEVHITRAYQDRTSNFIPTNIDDILIKNAEWSDLINLRGSFPISDDISESYWLSLLAPQTNCDRLVSGCLLSEENISNITMVCSNLIDEKWNFQSVFEKALFQRDVFQLYYIFMNCTNSFEMPLEKSAMDRRSNALIVLKHLLQRLRLSESEHEMLNNEFRQDIAKAMLHNHFEDKCPFDLSRNYLPLLDVLDGTNWYEMRFAASENLHFNHYGGRSFVRIFVKVPCSQEQFYSYWDDIQKKYGDYVHTSSHVPPLLPGTQFMLVRTFAILLQDGTIADSGIPEEILVRTFKAGVRKIDSRSSDYQGTYYYAYKMSRNLLLNQPMSIGLKRRLDNQAIFYGFYQDVPDFRISHDAGLVTLRYNCIECHSLIHQGSGTVFSLEKSRLKDWTVDQFSGDLLQAVIGRPGRYIFGKYSENLALEK
jgi:hypothetical protein